MKLKIIFLLLGLLLTAVVLAEPVTLENEKLILTIDETNLDVSVTDKASGLTLYSGVNADGTGANKSWTENLRSALDEAIKRIDRELERKLEEFGRLVDGKLT